MFRVRIVNVDYYMSSPIPELDVTYSDYRHSSVKSVPVIRIFGSTPAGEKTCVHVHGVFPYICIPYDGSEPHQKLSYQLAASLDKAINIASGYSTSSTQHVYKVVLVSGIPFYGYHRKRHQFFKVYFYKPSVIKQAVSLLQNGAILNKVFQPHEAHVPFILQFFIDFNLHGMSFIDFQHVKFRRTNYLECLDKIPPELVLPETITAVSLSQLEVDASASLISNRPSSQGDGQVCNPGLTAIWDDEHRRRALLEGTLPGIPQLHSQRRPHSSTPSEIFFLKRIQGILESHSQPSNESTLSGGTMGLLNKSYAIEEPPNTAAVNASFVSLHVSEPHPEQQNPLETANLEDTIVDEELALMNFSMSQHVSQHLDKSLSLGYEDLELLDVLETLAGTKSASVDNDSILGSQTGRIKSFQCSSVENEEESNSEGEDDKWQDKTLVAEEDDACKLFDLTMPDIDENAVLNSYLVDEPLPGPSRGPGYLEPDPTFDEANHDDSDLIPQVDGVSRDPKPIHPRQAFRIPQLDGVNDIPSQPIRRSLGIRGGMGRTICPTEQRNKRINPKTGDLIFKNVRAPPGSSSSLNLKLACPSSSSSNIVTNRSQTCIAGDQIFSPHTMMNNSTLSGPPLNVSSNLLNVVGVSPGVSPGKQLSEPENLSLSNCPISAPGISTSCPGQDTAPVQDGITDLLSSSVQEIFTHFVQPNLSEGLLDTYFSEDETVQDQELERNIQTRSECYDRDEDCARSLSDILSKKEEEPVLRGDPCFYPEPPPGREESLSDLLTAAVCKANSESDDCAETPLTSSSHSNDLIVRRSTRLTSVDTTSQATKLSTGSLDSSQDVLPLPVNIVRDVNNIGDTIGVEGNFSPCSCIDITGIPGLSASAFEDIGVDWGGAEANCSDSEMSRLSGALEMGRMDEILQTSFEETPTSTSTSRRDELMHYLESQKSTGQFECQGNCSKAKKRRGTITDELLKRGVTDDLLKRGQLPTAGPPRLGKNMELAKLYCGKPLTLKKTSSSVTTRKQLQNQARQERKLKLSISAQRKKRESACENQRECQATSTYVHTSDSSSITTPCSVILQRLTKSNIYKICKKFEVTLRDKSCFGIRSYHRQLPSTSSKLVSLGKPKHYLSPLNVTKSSILTGKRSRRLYSLAHKKLFPEKEAMTVKLKNVDTPLGVVNDSLRTDQSQKYELRSSGSALCETVERTVSKKIKTRKQRRQKKILTSDMSTLSSGTSIEVKNENNLERVGEGGEELLTQAAGTKRAELNFPSDSHIEPLSKTFDASVKQVSLSSLCEVIKEVKKASPVRSHKKTLLVEVKGGDASDSVNQQVLSAPLDHVGKNLQRNSIKVKIYKTNNLEQNVNNSKNISVEDTLKCDVSFQSNVTLKENSRKLKNDVRIDSVKSNSSKSNEDITETHLIPSEKLNGNGANCGVNVKSDIVTGISHSCGRDIPDLKSNTVQQQRVFKESKMESTTEIASCSRTNESEKSIESMDHSLTKSRSRRSSRKEASSMQKIILPEEGILKSSSSTILGNLEEKSDSNIQMTQKKPALSQERTDRADETPKSLKEDIPKKYCADMKGNGDVSAKQGAVVRKVRTSLNECEAPDILDEERKSNTTLVKEKQTDKISCSTRKCESTNTKSSHKSNMCKWEDVEAAHARYPTPGRRKNVVPPSNNGEIVQNHKPQNAKTKTQSVESPSSCKAMSPTSRNFVTQCSKGNTSKDEELALKWAKTDHPGDCLKNYKIPKKAGHNTVTSLSLHSRVFSEKNCAQNMKKSEASAVYDKPLLESSVLVGLDEEKESLPCDKEGSTNECSGPISLDTGKILHQLSPQEQNAEKSFLGRILCVDGASTESSSDSSNEPPASSYHSCAKRKLPIQTDEVLHKSSRKEEKACCSAENKQTPCKQLNIHQSLMPETVAFWLSQPYSPYNLLPSNTSSNAHQSDVFSPPQPLSSDEHHEVSFCGSEREGRSNYEKLTSVRNTSQASCGRLLPLETASGNMPHGNYYIQENVRTDSDVGECSSGKSSQEHSILDMFSDNSGHFHDETSGRENESVQDVKSESVDVIPSSNVECSNLCFTLLREQGVLSVQNEAIGNNELHVEPSSSHDNEVSNNLPKKKESKDSSFGYQGRTEEVITRHTQYSCFIKTLRKPPSRNEVIDSLQLLNLPEAINLQPFFSNYFDVKGKSEIGGNILDLSSKSWVHLEEFRSSIQDLEGLNVQQKHLFECLWGLSQIKGDFNQLLSSHLNHRMKIITPVKRPPRTRDVALWIRARQIVLQKRGLKNEVTQIVNPQTDKDAVHGNSQNLLSDSVVLRTSPASQMVPDISHKKPGQIKDPSPLLTPTLQSTSQRNTKMTIVSPKQHRKNLAHSQSSLPSVSEKDKDVEDVGVWCQEKESVGEVTSTIQSRDSHHDSSLQHLLLDSQFFSAVTSPVFRHVSDASVCQIKGVNASPGFKVNLENLQTVKTKEHQYTTILTMEVHVCTCGSLKPDPERDPIRGIFYSVCNDVPEDSIIPQQADGIIAVSFNNSSVPLLSRCGIQGEVEYVSDEKLLVQNLLQLVQKWDPDILAGFEIEMQSWGYVLQRASALGINLIQKLSRIQNEKEGMHLDDVDENGTIGLKITGRIVLDVWRLFRPEIALQSYTFENLMYHILHQRVSHHSFENLSRWWENPSHLYRWITVRYYQQRVNGVLKLLDQLDIIGRTSELARLFGIQFFEVLSRGSQFRVESMMLRLAKPLNYIPISPSVQQRAHMRAPECLPLIMEPESRFYSDPLIVLDFQSLYPSMIIAYNYCFSTCLGRVEHLGKPNHFEFGCSELRVTNSSLQQLRNNMSVSPCGVAFVTKAVCQGILPRMLEEILEARLAVKQSMKLHKNDKTLQRVLHARQLGLKLIANVTYGYTSANFSGRMPCIEVGDSVVSKGRETLERAISLVQSNDKWRARVVYGDTDSLFVLVPGRSRQEAFRIGEEIASAVTQDNPSPVKLKLEKVYQPSILQTKKRYVGFMYENPDQKEPVYEAKGIETVRRDGCPAVAKILEKSLRILFETYDVSSVKNFVCHQFTKLLSGLVNIQDLIFAREYRGKESYRPGACVPALELTKRWLRQDRRAEPRIGERVPYVIVNGPPGSALIHLVRHPTELLSDCSLRYNAVYYVTRAIIPPLSRCLSLLGADVSLWYADLPRKNQVLLPTLANTGFKRTISQYFSTMDCVCCGKLTCGGVCVKCHANPQLVVTSLMSKVHNWESTNLSITKICQSCVGRLEPLDCSSLDCPITYRRHQSSHKQEQSTFLTQILKEYVALSS